MELTEVATFQLAPFSPRQLCPLPGQGRVVAVSEAGEMKSLDIVSGAQLDVKGPEGDHPRILCRYHENTEKMVVAGGGLLGARAAIDRSLLLRTILQTQREDGNELVAIELTHQQAKILLKMMESSVLIREAQEKSINNKQIMSLQKSLTAQLSSEICESEKMNISMIRPVLIEGPYQQLSSLFGILIEQLRKTRRLLSSSSYSSAATSSPTLVSLPLLSDICFRLKMLHPDHTPQLQEGADLENRHCEVIRRFSLRKWPHTDYKPTKPGAHIGGAVVTAVVAKMFHAITLSPPHNICSWAVASTMAEAGFYHVSNAPHVSTSSAAMSSDRVSCFTCNVHLRSWEPHDEPWSEHERHANQCPFMRGDPTENIPLKVTEGTRPAVRVVPGNNDEITSLTVDSDSNLVAIATRRGILSVWDIREGLSILSIGEVEVNNEILKSQPDHDITECTIISLSFLKPLLLVATVTINHSSGSTYSSLVVYSVKPLKIARSSVIDITLTETDISLSSTSSPTVVVDDEKQDSLTLLSVLPLSSLLHLPHNLHHHNLLFQLTHSLSHSLALYATRPHPLQSEEVKGDSNEDLKGCLMILDSFKKKKVGVVSPARVIKTITREEEEVVDMCHVAMGYRDGMKIGLVVVTTSGELQMMDIESLEIIKTHRSRSGCGFSHCISWRLSTDSWIAMTTREGTVEVIRLGEGGGGEGRGRGNVLEDKLLTEKLDLQTINHLLSLTVTSPVGVVFSVIPPQQWIEISRERFHRKIPVHMHGMSNSHSKIWQYLPPPTSDCFCDDFSFDITLPSSCSPVGCVSISLSLPSSDCLRDTATLSLILPATGTQHTVLCGPVPLKHYIDITGCNIQVSLSHPLLLSPPLPPLLTLKLEHLFPTDLSSVAMATAEAHAPSQPARPLHRGRCIRQRYLGGGQNRNVVPEQCYLSLSLFPLSSCQVPDQDKCFNVSIVELLEYQKKREFILNVLLGVCGYSVVDRELSVLPPPLQSLVVVREKEEMEEVKGERVNDIQIQSLMLLNWICNLNCVVSYKDDLSMMLDVVSQLSLSLFYHCYLTSYSRITAQLCSHIVTTLYRSQSHQNSSRFIATLRQAFPTLLPLLPLAPSAACIRWFLRVVTMVTTGSHESHVIMQQCLEMLVKMAEQLEKKSNSMSHKLQAIYSQDAAVLEPEAFDTALTYYQRPVTMVTPQSNKFNPVVIPSALNPSHHLHSLPPHVHPPPLPPSSSVHLASAGKLVQPHLYSLHNPHTLPPVIGGPLNPPPAPQQNTPSTEVVYSKSDTPYDAELQLLLGPPPLTFDLAKKSIMELPPFQHGSYLLYSQRGLLETFPLVYYKHSTSPGTLLREPLYHNTTSSLSSSSSHQSDTPVTSGYYYPNTPDNSESTPPLSYSVPKTSQSNIPEEMTGGERYPKELVMVVDLLQSGKAYWAVVGFRQSVYLTDISISANPAAGCVSVDVWGEEEGEEAATRLAISSEIQDKNLMLGCLNPPPLCRYMKITFTGKLGATRERVRFLLGAYHGVPHDKLMTTPTFQGTLQGLHDQLKTDYHRARDELLKVLRSTTSDDGGEGGGGGRGGKTVRDAYHSCSLAQTRLARLHNYQRSQGDVPGLTGGIINLKDTTESVNYSGMSLSHASRVADCLVNSLLILSSHDSITLIGLPQISERDSQLLLTTLCVHGVTRIQARTCALLLHLSSSQTWWGNMVTTVVTQLFSSQNILFNKQRTLLEFSALCQRSYQYSSILTSLLSNLASSPPPSTATTPSSSLPDSDKWLVILLSHSLSSITSSSSSSSSSSTPPHKDPNLFSPIVMARDDIERSKSVGLTPSLPGSLCHKVVERLMVFCISLLEDRDWIMLPIVCKAISLLVKYSSRPLSLSSLFTSSQLTLLLSAALSNPAPQSPGNRHYGNRHWAVQSAMKMILSVVNCERNRGLMGRRKKEEKKEEEEEKESKDKDVVQKVTERNLPVKGEVVMVASEGGGGEEEGSGGGGGGEKPDISVLVETNTTETQSSSDPLKYVSETSEYNWLQPDMSTPPLSPSLVSLYDTHEPLDIIDPFQESSSPPPPPLPPLPPVPLECLPFPGSHDSVIVPVPTTAVIKNEKTSLNDSVPSVSKTTTTQSRQTQSHTPSSTHNSKVNPYRSYVISNTVDERMRYGLGYPAELAIQRECLRQYDALLMAVSSAQSSHNHRGYEEKDEEEEEEEEEEAGGEELLQSTLCELLEIAKTDKPKIDLVQLLQFWNELITVLNNKSPLSHVPNTFSLYSTSIISKLIECLNHAHSGCTHSFIGSVWYSVFSLINKVLDFTTSPHLLLPSHLFQLLHAYFLSDSDVGVARGVVSQFLSNVLVLSMREPGRGIGGEGEEEKEKRSRESDLKGAHMMYQVLVEILEKRSSILTERRLQPLLEVLVRPEVPRILFPRDPAPCVSAIESTQRLMKSLVIFINSSLFSPPFHNVKLYSSQLDPRKPRLRANSTARSSTKWSAQPFGQNDSNRRSKVILYLLKLLRNILTLIDISRDLEIELSEMVTMDTRPMYPLACLLYAETDILEHFFSLLIHPSLSTPDLRTIAANFIVELYNGCPDCRLFHLPLLRTFDSAPRPLPSSLVQFIVGVACDSDSSRLQQFMKSGGVRIMLNCLIQSASTLPNSSTSSSSSSSSSYSFTNTLHSITANKSSTNSTHLINYLPQASLRMVTPGNARSLKDLQSVQQAEPPSRSTIFQHTFKDDDDEEIVLSATLPHPILFHCLQLYQPLGLPQDCPSSILILTSPHANLAPPTPATPTLPTSGLNSVKIEFPSPVVAQEVRVHMGRPVGSNTISLSHMFLMGSSGGMKVEEEEEVEEKKEEKGVGKGDKIGFWLNVLDKWMRTNGDIVMEEAAKLPQLVPSYLSILNKNLQSEEMVKMLALLKVLGETSQEVGESVLRHLFQTPGNISPLSVYLLYDLTVPSDQTSLQRLSYCLGLISGFQDSTVSLSVPVLVHTISSAVYHGKFPSQLPEQVFSSLVTTTLSCDMRSSLRRPLISLLLSITHHFPDHLQPLLDQALTTFSSSSPHLPPQLSILSNMAHSPTTMTTVLTSPLVTQVITELTDTFSKLSTQVVQSQRTANDLSDILRRACCLLAFLTDLARYWTPIQDWLGKGGRSNFWPHLLHFLSSLTDSHTPSIQELLFVRNVGVEFFKSVTHGSHSNKVFFSQLLVNSISGIYSFEKIESPTLNNAHLPLSEFAHCLLVDVVLHFEPCTVIVELRDTGKIPPPLSSSSSSSSSISLSLAHSFSSFHPSIPVGYNKYVISCPHSLSLSELANVLLPPSPKSSKVTAPAAASSSAIKTISLKQALSLASSKRPLRVIAVPTRPAQPKLRFSNSDYSNIPLETKLSQLTRSRNSSHHPSFIFLIAQLSPSFVRPSLPPQPSQLPPSLLQTFADYGGLSLLSNCLSPTTTTTPTAPTDPLLHSLVTLRLCLKMRCYGDALLKDVSLARCLLLKLLGSEFTSKDLDRETTECAPYVILLDILTNHIPPDKEGVVCRETVIKGGVIDQLLFSLSTVKHLSSQTTPTSRATPTSQHSSNGKDVGGVSRSSVSVPNRGMESRPQYWAKGTGFGTGSTASEWNMTATRNQEKGEKKLVCLVFAIIRECLAGPDGRGQWAESWVDSSLADLLLNSCLLPALATYLVNDSFMDISKHVSLYQAALGVVYSLTLHPPLLPLLTNPISSITSSNGPSISLLSLAHKLKSTAQSYSRTTRLTRRRVVSREAKPRPGVAKEATPTKPSPGVSREATPTESHMPRRVKVNMDSQNDGGVSPESELTELTSEMLSTANQIISVTSTGTGEVGGGGEKREGKENEKEKLDSSDDYMETMKPLQFDTYQMIEEEEEGKVTVVVPYHYQKHLKPSLSSCYGPVRARRLAQEVSSLATSLPLSSSSSVFVRCDENRLDVMKVLITGPSDTPYANGCFEFDVLFPEQYPAEPMLVNLLTTGHGTVRFNPNLYNDGKVCLSVLNTWHGRPEERWHHDTSSFLQVLVSIQSLVLVADPYFNEPGYEKHRGTPFGDQRSLEYNAGLYVANVQWAMIHQLQNPSPCFREVILKHFLLRHNEVIKQCSLWVQELVTGMKRMQQQGMATATLSPLLHKLLKHIDILKTELTKIPKKLSTSGASSNTN